MMKLEMINGTYHIIENGRDIKDTGTNNKDHAQFILEDLKQVYGIMIITDHTLDQNVRNNHLIVKSVSSSTTPPLT